MARTNRGGSVLGFSIATLVMAGLLIGGAYTLRQLTSQSTTAVAQNDTPQSQTKPDVDQSKGDKTNSDGQKSDSSSQNTNTGTVTPPSASGSTPATQLPQTGPGSLLGTVAALSLLSATAVAYARSRRPELSL